MPRPPAKKEKRASIARKREPSVFLSIGGNSPACSEVKHKHVMRGNGKYLDCMESCQGKALRIKKEDKKKRARRRQCGIHNLAKFRPKQKPSTGEQDCNVLVGLQSTMQRERRLHA